jgi:hypothetical protein
MKKNPKKMTLNRYEPTFKIIASSPEDAMEISNFIINLMNKMPNERLVKVARKVNENPDKKIKKMCNYINLL